MNKIRQFFNDIAPTWHNDESDELINSLLNELDIKNGDMVLDLACGKGVMTPYLYERTKNKVVAIDISDNMIAAAKAIHQGNDGLVFICADFLDYDFKEKFDHIIIYNAYPHFLDVEKLSQKAFSLLNKDGHLAIVHSISKEHLNSHHKQKAMGVSRYLEEASIEAKKFKALFNVVKCLDDENKYLILLKANN